jgi:hypothetical protein
MEETGTTFSIRFDARTKQILCAVLDNTIQQVSQSITAGDYSEDMLAQHEELVQVKRGILYTRPDEVEEPVVGPEAGINGGHGIEAPTEVTL